MMTNILFLLVLFSLIGIIIPNVYAIGMFDNSKLDSQNIYVNDDYNFAISYPDNWLFEENAEVTDMVEGDSSSIVAFYVESFSNYPANFAVLFFPVSPQEISELSSANDNEILDVMTYSIIEQFDNPKIIDTSIRHFSDGFIVDITFIHIVEFSHLTDLSSDEGTYVTLKRNTVQYWLDDGNVFSLNFSALSDEFNSTHKDFKKSLKTFVVDDYIKFTTHITENEKSGTWNPATDTTDSRLVCGGDTIPQDGKCVTKDTSQNGGGCLIATATYGSEMALEVQQLRELRDNSLLQTESGTSFMSIFNDIYYSFSPIIADYERENLVFKEVVKLAITPMISSLSILNYVDMDSESSVLGYGISLIILNLGMYLGVPAVVVIGIRKYSHTVHN